GGILERDEDIVAGLRREIREETGLDTRPDGLSGVYKNMTQGIIALVFRGPAPALEAGASRAAAPRGSAGPRRCVLRDCLGQGGARGRVPKWPMPSVRRAASRRSWGTGP